MSTRAQRWQQVRRLLDEALALPAAERAAFLHRACGNDDALKQEVASLVEQDEELGDFLAEPFFSLRGEDLDVGRRLGPYRLVRRIGRGGMGVVYLAERVDGELRQQVAIKLLKRGLDTDEIVRRFQMERQILASLTHPYVARLLDAGTTGNGRPFLVMEHVVGEAIDVYCDARHLTTRQRVELFRRVCEPVHFAHRNLVVHRDLKPANLLIAEDGTPKLLDFGIAKLLERDPRVSAVTAGPESVPLSLPYASPEQLTGGAMTTAADVYALGVVLYELLTGRRPHRSDGLSPEQVARKLYGETPAKPSTAVQRREEAGEGDHRVELTPGSVSQVRDGDVRRLVRHLRGDLDNIVLRALEPEPEHRFASVEQLSEELRRYLEGLPVRSRPPTFFYRTGKFVRRNALGVATATLVAVLLLGFGLAMAAERQKTAKERDRSEAVTDFLIDFLQAPDRFGGESLTVHEALEQGVKKIPQNFAEQPEIRAALLDTTGGVYRNLALPEKARPLLEEALELRLRLYGDDHVLVAETLHNLANLERDEGRRAEAEELMRRALVIQRHAFPNGHRDLAAGLNNLALLLRRRKQLDEAEALAREALAMKEALFGPEHLEVTKPLNTLARVRRDRGALEEAEKLYRRSLALRRRWADSTGPDLATALNALASVLVARGNPQAALPLYEEALGIRRTLHLRDHPELVTSLNNLGRGHLLVGEPESALILLEEGAEMAQSLAAGGKLRPVAFALMKRSLIWARMEAGNFTDCEEMTRSVLEVFRQRKRAQNVAEAESLLGVCLVGLQRFDDAEPYLLAGYNGLRESAREDALMTQLAHRRLLLGRQARGHPE